MKNDGAMAILHWANLALAIVAALAPLAHVLELPNKLALSGPLWLAVQQHLYRGWGPFLGGPAEIGALVTTSVLLIKRRSDPRTRGLTAATALCYGAMIAVFFVFNNPVNRAINGWTPAKLPANWGDYRFRWESGHALAALLAVIGLGTLVRARLEEHDFRKLARIL